MDCSLPGSSVRGIFQARVLEWGAIDFSKFSTRFLLLFNYYLLISKLFGHLMRRVDSLEKTDAGRDWGQEEKGMT